MKKGRTNITVSEIEKTAQRTTLAGKQITAATMTNLMLYITLNKKLPIIQQTKSRSAVYSTC
jgi:hypothetical protein